MDNWKFEVSKELRELLTLVEAPELIAVRLQKFSVKSVDGQVKPLALNWEVRRRLQDLIDTIPSQQ